MPLGNGLGIGSPSGQEPQGPSLPVDNNLEFDAKFLSDMVTEMQEGTAKKTQRMVIERTIRGRPMIKGLNDCLKLHLSTFFILATLLTRGFFKALFSDEKGTKTTQKVIVVEWCGMNFSFSRYVSNFYANA
jgi:hypothetical protein